MSSLTCQLTATLPMSPTTQPRRPSPDAYVEDDVFVRSVAVEMGEEAGFAKLEAFAHYARRGVGNARQLCGTRQCVQRSVLAAVDGEGRKARLLLGPAPMLRGALSCDLAFMRPERYAAPPISSLPSSGSRTASSFRQEPDSVMCHSNAGRCRLRAVLSPFPTPCSEMPNACNHLQGVRRLRVDHHITVP
jgi:hypothetical protein